MNNPKHDLLVKGIAVGDLKSKIVGYYHYDNVIEKHFIVTEKSCTRHEVVVNTVELINKKV